MKDVSIIVEKQLPSKFSQIEKLSTEFIEKRMNHFLGTSYQLKTGSKIEVSVSSASPFVDCDLIDRGLNKLINEKLNSIKFKGAIPGTSPIEITNKEGTGRKILRWGTQEEYNSQLNLFRGKRAKMFGWLCNNFEDLPTWSVQKLMDYFAGKEGVETIVRYGEDVILQSYENCPLCGSKDRFGLKTHTAQAHGGFLNKNSEIYFECQDCSLVFQDPQMHEEDLFRYYDHWAYEQPASKAELLELYQDLNHQNTSHYFNYVAIEKHLKSLNDEAKILDLGGGRGEFVVYARGVLPKAQIELNDFRVDERIQEAIKVYRIDCASRDFINYEFESEQYNLITNWEVIEHIKIEKLQSYLNRVATALVPGGLYCLSTPDFDDLITHSLDFWGVSPGEHLSVLSRKVLTPLLEGAGLKIIDEMHECVLLKEPNRWYSYGEENASSSSTRGDHKIINSILQDPELCQKVGHNLRERNLGSELILVCQKN